MDFIIRQFKNDVVSVINNAQLPLEVKRLVLKEIYEELCRVTEDIILQEQQAAQQKNVEGKEKEDEPVT